MSQQQRTMHKLVQLVNPAFYSYFVFILDTSEPQKPQGMNLHKLVELTDVSEVTDVSERRIHFTPSSVFFFNRVKGEKKSSDPFDEYGKHSLIRNCLQTFF